jgi:phosphoenolpyruvate carboxylase
LPGWYGFGSAVEQFINLPGKQSAEDKRRLLQKMQRDWPFFKTLLSNMDMVIAKSDLALASRYAELVQDAKLRKKILLEIEAEWQRTARALQIITGEPKRLASNAALARSIQHRFPYIDPLHHLIRRFRAGKKPEDLDEKVQRGIHISINGIAAGLRNTG